MVPPRKLLKAPKNSGACVAGKIAGREAIPLRVE
jgi:hypothetical protein